MINNNTRFSEIPSELFWIVIGWAISKLLDKASKRISRSSTKRFERKKLLHILTLLNIVELIRYYRTKQSAKIIREALEKARKEGPYEYEQIKAIYRALAEHNVP